MSKLSDKYCEVCLQKGHYTKVRTLCDECRELLCKECAAAHLLYKVSKHHNLINLDLAREEPRTATEDELSSDFLEYATVSETTDLRRAQVPIKSEPRRNKTKRVKTKEKDTDLSKLNPTKVLEFSVRLPDDRKGVDVRGLLALKDKVVIADYDNNKLKLYEHNGNYLSSADLAKPTWGITRIATDKFATCGGGNKVYLWTLRDNTIVSEYETYDVDHESHGIHYNGTYFCVLHQWDNAVTILDRQGKWVKMILMEKAYGKKLSCGWDILMDKDTDNIYIPCSEPKGLLCVTIEGDTLWFTRMPDVWLWGITEIYDALCVTYTRDKEHCLCLMSKTGQYIGILLGKDELMGNPCYIYYYKRRQKLFIGHMLSTDEEDIISVFSV